jgi:hypothetical protein
MQRLFVQCLEQDPAHRPSFGEIFDMFAANGFHILPRADRVRIRDFADRVLAWERKAKVAESSTPR